VHNSLYKLFVKTELFYKNPVIKGKIFLYGDVSSSTEKYMYLKLLSSFLNSKMLEDYYDAALVGFDATFTTD
jgi:hypothetical protein